MRQHATCPRKLSITLTGLGLLAAGSAAAEPSLSTPPILSNLAGVNAAICQVFNIGNKPAEVVIEIRTDINNVVATSGVITLQPEGQSSAYYPGTQPNSYCKVTGLSAKTGRVTFTHLSASTPVMFVTAP